VEPSYESLLVCSFPPAANSLTVSRPSPRLLNPGLIQKEDHLTPSFCPWIGRLPTCTHRLLSCFLPGLPQQGGRNARPSWAEKGH
jgi:hypothetical protein